VDAAQALGRILGAKTASWSALEKINLENFAVAFAQVPNLASWTRSEKHALVQIIRAKAAHDEMKCLHLTQKHERWREVLLKLGS
jgi:hypothetical protein